MSWFPVPRYCAIQRGACRSCGYTILYVQPSALTYVFGLICCKCGIIAGTFDAYE